MTSDIQVQQVIERYVQSLKETDWIQSDAVAAAFTQVPRHLLIEKVYQGRFDLPAVTNIDPSNAAHLALVYSDNPLFIHWPEISASSQPSLMALVLESLGLQPGMRILEIGAGSGYNAALMAQMVTRRGSVTTIDIQEGVVAQARRGLKRAGYGHVQVLAKDGFYGHAEGAPYDRIVGTVGCMLLSPDWVEQLAEDGWMLIPLAHGGISNCPLMRIEKKSGQLLGRVVAYTNFMPVRGDSSLDLWPSDRKVASFKRIIRHKKANSVLPLFEGLKKITNPTPRPGKGAARLEFLYFLALHTPYTFQINAQHIGVGERAADGFVLLSEDSIELYGAQAGKVYEEVKRLYQKWLDVGKPRMMDYEIEFLPVTSDEQPMPAPSERCWLIERKFYRQIVRL